MRISISLEYLYGGVFFFFWQGRRYKPKRSPGISGTCFTGDGIIDREIKKKIGEASAVIQALQLTDVVKKEPWGNLLVSQ